MNTVEMLRSWQEVLRDICRDSRSKQEIAERIGDVSVRTLDRWLAGQGRPQKQYIKKLAALSPEMKTSLEKEFPEAFLHQSLQPQFLERVSLPAEFSRRILRAYALTPSDSLRWAIFHHVERTMIPHIDPEKTGLAVLSVRETNSEIIQFEDGAGNSAWVTRQVITSTCEEPWLIQIVKTSRPCFIQSLADEALEPPPCFARANLIQSMAFFPLYRAGVACGGMLLLSASTDFFTPLRQILIEEYSYLMALAFRDADFR